MEDHERAIVHRAVKERIRERMSQGYHIYDAASAEGVSVMSVIANLSTDRDFREWYELSKDRVRLSGSPIPETVDGYDIKEAYLKALVRAGAIEKVATVIALADPTSEEGKKDLRHFALPSLRETLPKELRQTNPDKDRPVTLTAEDAQRMLAENSKMMEEMQKKISDSSSVYLEEDDGTGPEEGTGGETASGEAAP